MSHSSRRHLEVIVRDAAGAQLTRCLIRRGRYLIGQDGGNEIVVNEPSVSAQHARLTVIDETEFFIEDLGSKNGVFINGEPVTRLTPVAIESRLQIGATTLAFQRAGLPAALFEHLPEGFLRAHRYDIGEVVVQGSTSTIFEARDTSLSRDVAIKVMRPESQAQPALVLRFIREAQITSQLQHPNILPIYELSLDEQSQLFYTTRFVEGSSLAVILEELAARDRRAIEAYPLATLLAIFQKVCDAVAFAHAHGVVHGGLRPDAITVGRFGEVFVGNWNLARVLPLDADGAPFAQPIHAPEATSSALVSAFTAPEQTGTDPAEISPAADIYALGGILHQMLTLRPPIAPSDAALLLERIRAGEIEPITAPVPEALGAVVLKALSFDAADRPSSVAALQREIVAWQAGPMNEEGGLWKQVSGLLGRH